MAECGDGVKGGGTEVGSHNHNHVWKERTFIQCVLRLTAVSASPHVSVASPKESLFLTQKQSHPRVRVLWLSSKGLLRDSGSPCLWLCLSPRSSEYFASSFRGSHERLLGYKKQHLLLLPHSIGQICSHDPTYLSRRNWEVQSHCVPKRKLTLKNTQQSLQKSLSSQVNHKKKKRGTYPISYADCRLLASLGCPCPFSHHDG